MTGGEAASLSAVVQQQFFQALSLEFKNAIQDFSPALSKDPYAYLQQCLQQEEQRIDRAMKDYWGNQQQQSVMVQQSITTLKQQLHENQHASVELKHQMNALENQHAIAQAAVQFEQAPQLVDFMSQASHTDLFTIQRQIHQEIASTVAQLGTLKKIIHPSAIEVKQLNLLEKKHQQLLEQKNKNIKAIKAFALSSRQDELRSVIAPLLDKHQLADIKGVIARGVSIDNKIHGKIDTVVWDKAKTEMSQIVASFLNRELARMTFGPKAYVLNQLDDNKKVNALKALIAEMENGAIPNQDFLERISAVLQQQRKSSQSSAVEKIRQHLSTSTKKRDDFERIKEQLEAIWVDYHQDALLLEKAKSKLDNLHELYMMQEDIASKDEIGILERSAHHVQQLLAQEAPSDDRAKAYEQINFQLMLNEDDHLKDNGAYLSDFPTANPLLKEEFKHFIGECYGQQLKVLAPDVERSRDMDVCVKSRIVVQIEALLQAVRHHMDSVHYNDSGFTKTQEILTKVLLYSNLLSDINVHAETATGQEKHTIRSLLSQYQTLASKEEVPKAVRESMRQLWVATNTYIGRQPAWQEAAIAVTTSSKEPGLH